MREYEPLFEAYNRLVSNGEYSTVLTMVLLFLVVWPQISAKEEVEVL